MLMDPGTPPNKNEVPDRLAISDVLHVHCRGLDRLESGTLKSCYWPDAEVDYGSYKGPAQAFAELVVAALGDNYALTRHCIGNVLIAIQGTTAHCESYVNADHLLPCGTQEMCFGGRYLDVLEQRDGRWRMLHRQVVMDWSRLRELEDQRDSEAFLELAKGTHTTDDPSYSFLSSGANRL